ncbi:MAG: DUF1836 domain-containing protein [Clostridiales bacterium]|nr:DUF1836 domain-containing protein [Clostridiales bacterium]
MCKSKKEIAGAFEESVLLLSNYSLPSWEELPGIDLYMDQVIEIVNGYIKTLGFLMGEGSEITKPMINNYVKLKMMPAPEKKKYSRTHIAYIIIICILKQTLNIATIQKLIPVDIPKEKVQSIYASFVVNQQKAFGYVAEMASKIAGPILSNEANDPARMNDLMIQAASSANILKCLAEKLIDMN